MEVQGQEWHENAHEFHVQSAARSIHPTAQLTRFRGSTGERKSSELARRMSSTQRWAQARPSLAFKRVLYACGFGRSMGTLCGRYFRLLCACSIVGGVETRIDVDHGLVNIGGGAQADTSHDQLPQRDRIGFLTSDRLEWTWSAMPEADPPPPFGPVPATPLSL